jgi:hypothetical protein
METASEIPVVHVSVLEGDLSAEPDHLAEVAWSPVELPRTRRPSPTTIAIMAALAGLAAMALGAVAVLTAGDAVRTTTVSSPSTTTTTTPAERAALALIAKPSTQRVAFTGAGGRLLLAVGSGGRAAILLHGFGRAAPGRPYYAWALTPGARPVRAARFVGTEHAVFLTARLGAKTSVAITTSPSAPAHPAGLRLVATRG